MSDAQTLMASVSDDALTKVTRLFNASINDIIAELLQNARCSGATEIAIDCIDDPVFSASLCFRDDGRGLTDQQALSHLAGVNVMRATALAETSSSMSDSTT